MEQGAASWTGPAAIDALRSIPWEDGSLIEIGVTSRGIDLHFLVELPARSDGRFGYIRASFHGIADLNVPLRMGHFVPADYRDADLPDLGETHGLSIEAVPSGDSWLSPQHQFVLDWAYGTISFRFEMCRLMEMPDRDEG